MKGNERTLDWVIRILAIMLMIALLSLVSLKLYRTFIYEDPPSGSVIDHNVIGNPDNESGNDLDGNNGSESLDGTGSGSNPVQGNSSTSITAGQLVTERDTAAVNFYEMHYRYNERFSVSNMFPGDAIAQGYGITVNHIGPIDVTFKVVVEDDSQMLADALQVRLLYNNTVIHEGSMKNFSFTSRITSNVEQKDYLDYRVEVFLPTDTDNLYQSLQCNADFNWSADEVILENGESGKLVPDTSTFTQRLIHSDFPLYAVLLVLIIVLNILLWRKKDDE